MGDVTAPEQGPRLYQYFPLDENAGEIRLLQLLPSSFSAPVRVILETTSFSPKAPPQFEALSYTWGSVRRPRSIFVESPSCNTILPVTQNVEEALLYLRLEDRPRSLWIDAICINQSDMGERSAQVKRMADIYSKASQVIAWLGVPSGDSPMAFNLFEAICSKIAVDWQTYAMVPTTDDTSWTDVNFPMPLDQDQLNSISNLLDRPWFERLWIWQEVRLLSEDIIVQCGHQKIPWSSVCQAVLWLFKRGSSYSGHDRLRSRANLAFELCDRQSYSGVSISTLLDATKHCECSDPRDRIFALLSLISPNQMVPGIEVDYSKTVAEVYRISTFYLIKFQRTLEILAVTGLEENHFGLPSWVPKWPCRTTNCSLRYSVRAAGESLVEDMSGRSDKEILQLTGVSIATIDLLEGFKLLGYGSATNTEIGHELRRIHSWINLQRPFGEGSKDLLAFCRTICTDEFFEALYLRRGEQLSRKECLEALRTLLELDEDEDCWNMRFLAHVSQYVCGRSMFITTDGSLGLGPKTSKPGDIVTVLLGGESAYILRPANDGCYQFIGEAYCHGFMDGEALLGPLPERIHLGSKFEETSKISWLGHIDHETKDFYCEDPRLGELPPGWKRKQHPLDYFWTWFVNEETGEEFNDYGDPRLTSEQLKNRGVDVKVFNLI